MIETQGKSAQQVVDEIFKALVSQGGKCMNQGVCAHTDFNGRYCAFGVLLDPYDKELMKYQGSCDYALKDFASRLGVNEDFININIKLLRQLQLIHDWKWKKNLKPSVRHLESRFGIKSDWLDKWEAM